MTNVENKTAYPYITEFKKEPFKSFLLKGRKDIGNFYLSSYEKVLELYQLYNESILNEASLNLENIYWFLLLRKYIKQKVDVSREDLFNFIKSCEVEIIEKDHLGFKSSPNLTKKPDIWSSYYALASLQLLGVLNEYLSSKGEDVIVRQIKNFIYAHKKNNGFLHCFDKSCEECNNGPVAKTFYYVIESLLLIGIDVRMFKEQFRSYLKDRKKEPSIMFKLLSLKFFDLDSEVKDKEIQFLYQYQKVSGGFSFIFEQEDVDTTFWVVNILHIYSWLLDYNPARIYSFITEKITNIFKEITGWNLKILREVTQLVILLSMIWNRFIEEIERIVFKQLETNKYIDLNQIKNTFGLKHGLEEIVLYINLNYTFTLKKVDNTLEFNQYVENLSEGKRVIIEEIYTQLKNNSILSLSDIFKKYKGSFGQEILRLKEDIIPIIHDLISNHFFEGEIRVKKALFKTKYYLCLDHLFEKILIADNEINTERLYEEKSKLKDVRNDIYNMTLKLKNTIPQIREEIESYLLIDEVEFAKERLKFVLRNSLMEADFLNENIESSFNQELLYINLQATLGAEISQWNKSYSLLQNDLNELNSYLQEKIQEKESLKQYNIILDELDTKIYDIQDQINREVDSFKNYIVEVLDKGYNEEKFDLIIQAFNKISQTVSKYDGVIYNVSHQITSKEKKVAKNHKKIIYKWVDFKEKFEAIFADYTNGFQFFNELNKDIGNVKDNIQNGILTIKDHAKHQVADKKYQDAFKTIRTESDILLKVKTEEIQHLKQLVKKNTNFKQKLFPLYNYLGEKLDSLEENIIELIADQVQILKEKVIEERKRAKVEDFDNFVSDSIQHFKDKVEKYKFSIDQNRINKIPDVISGFDTIIIEFNDYNKKFSKKLTSLDEIEESSDENSIKIIQWKKFDEFLNNEITRLKDEYVNKIISTEIHLMSEAENTDKIDIKKLADKLKLKCKVIIPRIKDMIDLSKLQGDLLEDKKELIVHTEAYHKNRELKNFTEHRILKQTQEKVGQLLALYDSCIKNKTLGVNFLEIQNRINDIGNFKESINSQYNVKIRELNVDEKRIETLELSNNISGIINNNELAIEKIKENLELFKKLESFMVDEYDALKIEMESLFSKTIEDIEKEELYNKMKEILNNRIQKVDLKLKQVDDKIEGKLKDVLNRTFESKKFETEAREFYFKKKNEVKKL